MTNPIAPEMQAMLAGQQPAVPGPGAISPGALNPAAGASLEGIMQMLQGGGQDALNQLLMQAGGKPELISQLQGLGQQEQGLDPAMLQALIDSVMGGLPPGGLPPVGG